ncbi:Extracellular metalloproteinase MEP [Fulvia fulva]|uniref:Extracellular metalloproteinase n=1 Tax=Passalora fulva TaxID=5499 RepID=A0A9Q8LGH7_PASFU|nr:Extracellular metalloproteinase MEP [Fulvia fulva]KAK4627330.1 Extracellular metalloproteinase MEP [Fulvia fulva]UJO17060.1 Extracellular metalloproteinase MEP [Fulvia fulva]WPV13841.1 Extracellular metalloproteinase MEP [Fulvia fulva]WPV28521.1 Extracellular metalloproteinase MEP [Fulvia fulva]
MRSSQIAALSSLVLGTLSHPFHDSHALESDPEALQRRQLSSRLDDFRPQQRSRYVAEDGEISVQRTSAPASTDPIEAATNHLRSIHPDAEFRTANDNHVSSNGIAHVYFKQTLNGLDIDDADFNVNVRPDGTIFSYGSSFYTGPLPEAAPAPEEVAEPQPVLETVVDVLALPIQPAEADILVEETARSFTVQGLNNVESPPEGQLVYYGNAEGNLISAWRLETDVSENWLTTYVDATNENNILAVTDYVAESTYEVFKWPLNDPRGNRRTTEILPFDIRASSLGWHRDSDTRYTVTRGNNAIAQPNTDGDAEFLDEPRPSGGLLNVYTPRFDPALEPAQYIDASTVQLFYTSNYYRDMLYILGFTEAAGNFQTSNFGKGGVGGDSVILNTQDGSGLNNANFATPPDGQQGRMRMYVFNQSVPNRDSSFEAGIVIHEFTHGLTNRLTGGPANSRCLQVLESGGMGEGWSDFYATAIRSTPRDNRNTNYPIGDYAFNNPAGIRAFVYSTNMQTNPYTYSSLNTLTRVHQFGTVWCTMLYEMMWNLIDDHGNTALLRPVLGFNGRPDDGKYLSMKLVLDALTLQPCNPTFVQARNAILDADRALTKGGNQCSIWKAFAKRGLGENASQVGTVYTDDFTIPAGVC